MNSAERISSIQHPAAQTTHDGSFASHIDAALLALLILAMCSQIDPLTIGRDTFATEGFVRKQLKIALSDIALLLAFGWFALRTSALGAWRRLWWPPLPCWALLVAMLVAMLHSPRILEVIGEKMGGGLGLKSIIAVLKAEESQGAIAEILQFAAYFVAAPLLFVNLIHDRRGGSLIERRRFALHVFSVAVLLNVAVAAIQLMLGSGAAGSGSPRGLFGSSNIYGVFLALSLPLLTALVLREWRGALPPMIVTGVVLLLALLTMVSVWAVAALFIGVVVAGFALAAPRRAILVLGAMTIVAFVAWRAPLGFTPLGKGYSALSDNRAEFLHVRSGTQKVKKQYIEWYAALGWSRPRRQEMTNGVQQLSQFATGVGPGNYQLNIGPYYSTLPNEEKMPPDSNNLYLVQAVSLGLLGLGALLWVLGHFASVAWNAARAAPGDWLGGGVFASLCAFMAVNLFHAGIVRGAGIVLAFVLSLAVVAGNWSVSTERGASLASRDESSEADAGQSRL